MITIVIVTVMDRFHGGGMHGMRGERTPLLNRNVSLKKVTNCKKINLLDLV